MGQTILGCHGLRKPPEQGHYGSDVLACPGEVWEGFVVLDDPPSSWATACAPTAFVAVDLSLELRAFLLELESCFFEVLVSRPQLLYPQARWGPYVPLDLIIEVIC